MLKKNRHIIKGQWKPGELLVLCKRKRFKRYQLVHDFDDQVNSHERRLSKILKLNSSVYKTVSKQIAHNSDDLALSKWENSL